MKTLKKKEFDSVQLGWVSFERTLLDSPIIKNSVLSQIYLWSKLKANHKGTWISLRIGKGTQQVKCERGQFITGRHRAANELGLPPSTYNNNIKRLKDFGYIAIESSSHYSIITVLNYDCCADHVHPSGQQKENNKNTNRTTKEQQKNTNNNIKNYKNDNSFNNKEKYNKFLSDPIFTKSDKNLIDEYIKLVSVISSELPLVLSLKPLLSPDQFKGLRERFSLDQIIRKIKDIESWGKLTDKHNLLGLLQSFLARDRERPESESGRKSVGIPRISLKEIPDTDGNTKEEVENEYVKYHDKINWSNFNIHQESGMKRSLSKWLRICKYISKSNLSGLKELKPLRFMEFLILSNRSETVYSINFDEFEEMKQILNLINARADLENYRTVAKAISEYLKAEEN